MHYGKNPRYFEVSIHFPVNTCAIDGYYDSLEGSEMVLLPKISIVQILEHPIYTQKFCGGDHPCSKPNAKQLVPIKNQEITSRTKILKKLY